MILEPWRVHSVNSTCNPFETKQCIVLLSCWFLKKVEVSFQKLQVTFRWVFKSSLLSQKLWRSVTWKKLWSNHRFYCVWKRLISHSDNVTFSLLLTTLFKISENKMLFYANLLVNPKKKHIFIFWSLVCNLCLLKIDIVFTQSLKRLNLQKKNIFLIPWFWLLKKKTQLS